MIKRQDEGGIQALDTGNCIGNLKLCKENPPKNVNLWKFLNEIQFTKNRFHNN